MTQVYRHIDDVKLPFSRAILTMGNFDGIHLGHQALLQRVIQDARDGSFSAVVLTFEPHPLKVLAPERAPRLILAHKDKLRLLQSLGIDVVIIQTFNLAFAHIEAEEFVKGYLVDRLKVRKIWIGKDLRFGRGRKGRVEDLIRWGAEGGYEVGILEPVEVGGARVSSSRVRELIAAGQVHEVRKFLGRYHFVSGRVVEGHRRGRELGFPTANVASRTEVLPLDGIYATFFSARGRLWPSATSVGLNPTFGDGARSVESYVFDFCDDLYGEPVRLFFVQRIREERKFASPGLLVEQMGKDVARARELLDRVRPEERPALLG